MKILDFFNRCVKCNKSALKTEIGEDGYCPKCRDEAIRKAEAEAAEYLRKKAEEEARQHEIKVRAYINNSSNRRVTTPKFHGGGVRVCHYPRIPVVKVNRAVVEEMALDQSFSLDLEISGDEVVCKHGGVIVAQMEEKRDMCRDWLNRGDPIYCELANLRAGEERIILSFYRDEETRLEGRPAILAKLTSCRSEECQCNIDCADDGEALWIDPDSAGRLYVMAHPFEELGTLPAKFTKYDRSDIDAVIYDHGDEDPVSGKITPWVRVYLK